MTDYFSHFCFAVPFNSEQTAWAKRLLAAVNNLYSAVADGEHADPQYADIREQTVFVAGGDATDPVSTDIEIKTEQDLVLITDYAGQGSLDAVPRLIQSVMKHFEMEGKIGFEWGETASRSVPGAFGGGAFLISKDEIRSISAHSWLNDGLQHSRLAATNAILASWDFGSSGVTEVNLIDRRLAEPMGDHFAREMRLWTREGYVEASFDVEFARGTSIAAKARIHADGVDYGHSPIVAVPAPAALDDSPQP